MHGRCDGVCLVDASTDAQIIWFWSPKGGTGTSTVAAATAVRLAGEDRQVVLVDLDGDQPALIGLVAVEVRDHPGIGDWVTAPEVPPAALHRLREPVAPNLCLVRLGTRSVAELDAARRERLAEALEVLAQPDRVVVVDAGLDPHEHRTKIAAVPVCVVRNDYLALRAAQEVEGPFDNVVAIIEPQRGIRARDVSAALGAGHLERVDWDPRVARSIDAGTMVAMLPPPLLRSLGGLVGPYKQPPNTRRRPAAPATLPPVSKDLCGADTQDGDNCRNPAPKVGEKCAAGHERER